MSSATGAGIGRSPPDQCSRCSKCGFTTRHTILFERHKKRCNVPSLSAASSVSFPAAAASPSASSALLPAPSVCRNYKCSKCSFVSNKAKLFLYHQKQVHGENIAVYGCDQCEYASRHKNKVVRHKRLVHKVVSLPDDIFALDDHSSSPLSASAASPASAFDGDSETNKWLLPSSVDDTQKSSDGSLRDASECNAKDGVWIPVRRIESNSPDSDAKEKQQSASLALEAGLSGRDGQDGGSHDELNQATSSSKSNGDRLSNFLHKWTLTKPPNATDGLYRCKFCRYSNQHKWKIASHMRTSHSRKTTFKCPLCSFTTERKIEWCAHKTKHSGKAIYSCNECAYQTTMKRNFERHQERHLVNGPRRCSLCSYSSTGEGAIQRHMAEYHPPSPAKDASGTAAEASLNEFVETEEEEDLSLPNESPKISDVATTTMSSYDISSLMAFSSSVSLNPSSSYSLAAAATTPADTENKRGGRNSIVFGCVQTNNNNNCSNSNNNNNNMSNTPINNASPLQCRDLLVKSEPSLSLRSSSSSTSGVTRWMCSLCPLGYKRPADLNRHMKRKHGISLKDVRSSRHFLSTSNGSLLPSNTMATVSDSPGLLTSSFEDQPLNLSLKRDAWQFGGGGGGGGGRGAGGSTEQCEALDLSLKTRMKPISHVDRFNATPSSLFNCKCCSYATPRSIDLERHMSSYHSEKRFKCPICSKSFELQFDVNKHINSMHRSATQVAPPSFISTSFDIGREIGGRGVVLRGESSRERGTEGGLRLTPLSDNSLTGIEIPSLPSPLKEMEYELLQTSEKHDRLLKGLTPASGLTCKYCQYVGKYSAEVERHMKLHTGEKPHHCHFCDYKTIWKGDMKRHLLKHHTSEIQSHSDLRQLLDLTYKPSAGERRSSNDDDYNYEDSDDDNNDDDENSNRLRNDGSVGRRFDDCVDFNMNVETTDGRFVMNAKERRDNIMMTTHLTPVDGSSRLSSDNNNKHKNLATTFRCPLCEFVCDSPSKMKCHSELHDNLRRFMCTHCGKRSNCLWDIQKHIRKNHPGVDMTIRELSEEEAKSFLPSGDLLPSRVGVCDGRKKSCSAVKGELKIKDADEKLMVNCTVDNRSQTILKSESKDVAMDVETIAEQYANEVAAMFYGANCSAAAANIDHPPNPIPPRSSSVWVGGSSGQTTLPAQNTVKKFGRPSKSLMTNRFRPFKCSECGRRSNWRWDLNKHIRASHPSAHLIELSETDARATFHEVLNRDVRERRQMLRMSGPSAKHKPYMCDNCGHRSNWKCDLNKHIKALHPSARVVTLDERTAKDTIVEYDAQHAKKLEMSTAETTADVDETKTSKPSAIPEKSSSTPATVDAQKLKRFKCSACAYRSNFRSDVGRHIRHRHDKGTSRIIVMNENEAAATLKDYLDTWARKKFVSSPSKRHATGDRRKSTKPVGLSISSSVGCASKECSPGQEREEREKEWWKCSICGLGGRTKKDIASHWKDEHENQLLGSSTDTTNFAIKVEKAILEENRESQHRHQDGYPSQDTQISPDIEKISRSTKPEERSLVTPRKKSDFVRRGEGSTKNLSCNVCPYQTSKTGLLNIHKTYHRPNGLNKYKCRYCPYYVCASRLLHQHMRLHLRTDAQDQIEDDAVVMENANVAQDGDDVMDVSSCPEAVSRALGRTTYFCVRCPYISCNRNDYLYHRQFHRPRSTAAFKCDQCQYWVSQKRLLSQHAKVHGQEYKDRHAGLVFVQQNSISNGDVSMTTESAAELDLRSGGGTSKSNLSNDDGLYELPSKSSVNNNLEMQGNQFLINSSTRPSSCSSGFHFDGTKTKETICSEEINSSMDLNRRSMAGNDDDGREDFIERNLSECMKQNVFRKFVCAKCPFVTSKQSLLDSHSRLHGSSQKFHCSFCNYSIYSFHLLRQHEKLHRSIEYKKNASDKVLSSEKCSKSEDVSDSLYNEAKKIFCCDRCPYSNSRRDHLLCHMKFHQVKSELQCQLCDYSVSRVHLLNQHLKVHGISTAASHAFRLTTKDSFSHRIRQKTARNRDDDNFMSIENQTSFVVLMKRKRKFGSRDAVEGQQATSVDGQCSGLSQVEGEKNDDDDEKSRKFSFMRNLELKFLEKLELKKCISFERNDTDVDSCHDSSLTESKSWQTMAATTSEHSLVTNDNN